MICNLAMTCLLIVFDVYLFVRIVYNISASVNPISFISITQNPHFLQMKFRMKHDFVLSPRHLLGLILFQLAFFTVFVTHVYYWIFKQLFFPLMVLNVMATNSFGLIVFVTFGLTLGNYRDWINLCQKSKYQPINNSETRKYSEPFVEKVTYEE